MLYLCLIENTFIMILFYWLAISCNSHSEYAQIILRLSRPNFDTVRCLYLSIASHCLLNCTLWKLDACPMCSRSLIRGNYVLPPPKCQMIRYICLSMLITTCAHNWIKILWQFATNIQRQTLLQCGNISELKTNQWTRVKNEQMFIPGDQRKHPFDLQAHDWHSSRNSGSAPRACIRSWSRLKTGSKLPFEMDSLSTSW